MSQSKNGIRLQAASVRQVISLSGISSPPGNHKNGLETFYIPYNSKVLCVSES